MDKETLTYSFKMENPNFTTKKVLSDEENQEIKIEKQFNAKETSTNSIIVEVPSVFTDEDISQWKGVDTLMNTKYQHDDTSKPWIY